MAEPLGTPRWVKVAGLVALVLAVLVVVLLVTGRGGTHSPSRHAPPATTSPTVSGGHSPPAGIPAHGDQEP